MYVGARPPRASLDAEQKRRLADELMRVSRERVTPMPRRRASIELLNESKSPGAASDQALSGRRRGAYCTRNVDPKALPQASSAFRSVVCENIPNIAPHIAANIRMGMVCLRLHSEHQLARGLSRSIQNRSSTNISLYKIAHCNLLRSELCLPYSIRRRGARCQIH
jgi:hypothetical protein